MNRLANRFHLITLFFSILLCTSIHARHGNGGYVAHLEYQPHGGYSKEIRSHSDISYDNTWNSFGRGPSHQPNFNSYTAQDFKNYFTANGCTETQILLSKPCLYMFDTFVKFAQTYSGYKCSIRQLNATLKNLTLVQKIYCIRNGTYCSGLQKRIKYLHSQLNTIKIEQHYDNTSLLDDYTSFLSSGGNYSDYVHPNNCDPITATTSDILASESESALLSSIYKEHTPLLSAAIEKRSEAQGPIRVITTFSESDQYVTKSYSPNSNIKQLLRTYRHDIDSFTECFGNDLHHAIHQESLDILGHAYNLPRNSILYAHQGVLVDFAVAMVEYNHEDMPGEAMAVGDLCWTLLDYGQAIAEGAALGAYSAARDILTHPIQTTICILAGKQVLAYQLCKVLYNVADIGVTALVDTNHATKKWNTYTGPLTNIISAINKKEITLRDTIKHGTAFVVGFTAQSRLLGGLGKFCKTIKMQSIKFAKKASPQQYFTTPEGLLFKATTNSSKLKQSGQGNTASNLKNSIESKVTKNNSIKNGHNAAKQIVATSTTAGKGIIRNIDRNLRSTIKQYEGHIFSPEHKRKGILALGKDQETIMNSLHDVIMSVDKKGLLKEGPNQIKASINGINNIEIKCFIQKGEALSVDAYISDFNRIYNNFIDTTKV